MRTRAERRNKGVGRRGVGIVVSVLAAILVIAGTASVSAAETVAWQRVRLPGNGPAMEVQDIIAAGSGFIAVGGGTPDSSKPPIAKIWRSKTGRVWQQVRLQGLAREGLITAVTRTPRGFVAVGWRGCCPVRAYVWLSKDGLTWKRLRDRWVFKGGLMRDVTVHDGNLVAVGCRAEFHCLEGRVWRSSDWGRTWKVISKPGFIPEAVTSVDGRLLAAGATTGFDDLQPVTATSADGKTWQVNTPDAELGSHRDIGKRWAKRLVIGGTQTPDRQLKDATISITPDGQSFDDVALPKAATARLLAVDHRKGRTLLAGVRQTSLGTEKPYVWVTTDLKAYLRSYLPTGSKNIGGIVLGAAVSRNANWLVAGGNTYVGRAAMWFGKVQP